jgi:hypothetical protein
MHINKLGKWSEIVLYPTLEQQWQLEMAPHFKCKMGPEVDAVPVDAAGLKLWESTQGQRFQRSMIKAQWAVAQIVRHDMVESIVKWFDHELCCILGFLACSLETRTVKARKKDDPNRQIRFCLKALRRAQVTAGSHSSRDIFFFKLSAQNILLQLLICLVNKLIVHR